MKIGIGCIVLGCVLMLFMFLAFAHSILNEPTTFAEIIVGGLLVYVLPAVVLWGLGIWRILSVRRRQS